jgi:hypothetical protein
MAMYARLRSISWGIILIPAAIAITAFAIGISEVYRGSCFDCPSGFSLVEMPYGATVYGAFRGEEGKDWPEFRRGVENANPYIEDLGEIDAGESVCLPDLDHDSIIKFEGPKGNIIEAKIR